MKQSIIKNTGIILFSLASMMVSTAFAEEANEREMERQIVEQGEQALVQMQIEFKHNAFWNNSSKELATLNTQGFAPETATTTDCDQAPYPAEEKKTPGNSLLNPGQHG